MTGKKIQLTMPDGVADAYVSHPEGKGPWPGVIFFMDGLGLRETLYQMIDRLAAHGYYVLAPNMYYRLGEFAPFDPKTLFTIRGPEMDRVIKMAMSVDEASASRDIKTCCDFLAQSSDVRGDKFGCVGYCLGGGLAVLAACREPNRIAAAASIHGGRFLTEPGCPDAIRASLRAAVYIGIAEVDRLHTPEVTAHLTAALTDAGAPHTIEHYPGATHGFAIPDLPIYNEAAAEQHWQRVLALFQANL